MKPNPSSDPRPLFLRPWVWIVYAILFGVGIPWYWPEGRPAMVLGIPVWAAVTIGVSFALSCFTACLLAWGWPSEEE